MPIIHTPVVYAIELFEFPKEIPIAKFSAGETPSISSALILFGAKICLSLYPTNPRWLNTTLCFCLKVENYKFVL